MAIKLFMALAQLKVLAGPSPDGNKMPYFFIKK
jgi:hypothetical protein